MNLVNYDSSAYMFLSRYVDRKRLEDKPGFCSIVAVRENLNILSMKPYRSSRYQCRKHLGIGCDICIAKKLGKKHYLYKEKQNVKR